MRKGERKAILLSASGPRPRSHVRVPVQRSFTKAVEHLVQTSKHGDLGCRRRVTHAAGAIGIRALLVHAIWR